MDKKTGILKITFKKEHGGELFRNDLLKVRKLIQTRKVSRLLLDFINLVSMEDPDREWFEKQWFHMAIDSGIQLFAFLIPEDYRMTPDNVSQILEFGIYTDFFHNQEEAVNWLKTQEIIGL